MENLMSYERNAYLAFHRTVYKEDLALSCRLLKESPHWSIIIGYYAMHALAKLYLAEAHNLKLSGDQERSHVRVVEELQKVLCDTTEHNRVIDLLKKADDTFCGLHHPRQIPALLEKGRQERKRAQYYTRLGSPAVFEQEQAQEFNKKIVIVFVKLMEAMIDAP